MSGSRSALLAAAAGGSPFGEKYNNPSVLPAGNASGVAFSPAGDAIAIAHATSPGITVYRWTDSGFGEKYPNPSETSANVNSVAFSPTGSHIGLSVAGRLIVYEWSSQSGFGARILGDTTGVSNSTSVCFAPNGSYVALALGTSPLLAVYPWDNGVIGAPILLSNPVGSSGRRVAISPDSAFIGLVGVSMGVQVFPYSAGTIGSPFSASTGNVYGVDFSPDGSVLGIAGQNGRGAEVFEWSSSGIGAQLPSPAAVAFFGGAATFNFSPTSQFVAVGNFGLPYISLYRWLGNAMGQRYDNPEELPPGITSAAFSPNGNALAVSHSTTPFITVYRITAKP